jgi:hypothetical protein
MVKIAILVTGNDSAIAIAESGQIERKVSRSLVVIDINWKTPDSAICPKKNVEENGAAVSEMAKRARNPNTSLLVLRSSCPRLIARSILSKRPAGGSGGSRWVKSFS